MVVGDDSGAALVVSPAGLARRHTARGRIAIGVASDHAGFLGEDPAAPRIANRDGARALPSVSVTRAAGDLVFGFAVLVNRGDHSTLPAPAFDAATDTVERLYSHRYGGLSLDLSRQVIAAGGAWRATDWLAVGAALTASRTELSERRMLWGGSTAAGQMPSPTDDILISVAGSDAFSPGACAGVLVAPAGAPLEIAASARFVGSAHVTDQATLAPTHQGQMTITRESSAASLELPATIITRAGARYLGARITAEIDAAYAIHRGDDNHTWQTDLAVSDPVTGATAQITAIPSALTTRDQLTAGGSVDFAAAPGLVWLTAGYAFATGQSDAGHLSPTWVGLATHTVAVGAEAYFDGTTLAIGYAHTFARSTTVTADATDVRMIAPFEESPAAAAPGVYDTAEDRAALTVEITW
ncbi:MAG TPA: hypothetical protein VFG83_00840 [Kofleriaceae bacterium]|nr:hypothetical protein [Kofleriaceae bacterium]